MTLKLSLVEIWQSLTNNLQGKNLISAEYPQMWTLHWFWIVNAPTLWITQNIMIWAINPRISEISTINICHFKSHILPLFPHMRVLKSEFLRRISFLVFKIRNMLQIYFDFLGFRLCLIILKLSFLKRLSFLIFETRSMLMICFDVFVLWF